MRTFIIAMLLLALTAQLSGCATTSYGRDDYAYRDGYSRGENYQQGYGSGISRREGNTALGAILGAVGGGVLGSQFGRGSGKTAATIAGAVAGGAIGGAIGNSSGGAGRYESPYDSDRTYRDRNSGGYPQDRYYEDDRFRSDAYR